MFVVILILLAALTWLVSVEREAVGLHNPLLPIIALLLAGVSLGILIGGHV